MTPSTPSKKNSSNWQLFTILGLSGIGVALGAMLSHQYYQVRSGSAGFKSLCNLGQSMNCDSVAASRYAELIAGIPLSTFVTGWFAAIAIIAGLSLMRDWRRDGVRIITAMSAISVAFSLVYLYIMMSVIEVFCLYCLIIDGISVVTLILAITLKPESPRKIGFQPGTLKTSAGIVVASLFVAFVLLKGMEPKGVDASTRRAMVEQVLNAAPVQVNAGPELPSIGAKDAPITIVEFSDFQCPYCRMGAYTLNAVLKRNPGKVRVVFRNFPLDPSCNPLIKSSGHPVACEAARAVVCGHQQGKFEPVYEELFDRQAELAKARPTEVAKASAGVDGEALTACMAANETALAVSRDIEEGKQLNIQSTPTFFINGRKVEGLYPVPVWDELIERLLAAQKQ